jgi:hypothetical protein
VNEAYRLGANSFLVKPLEFNNLRELFSTIQWQLPEINAAPAPPPLPGCNHGVGLEFSLGEHPVSPKKTLPRNVDGIIFQKPTPNHHASLILFVELAGHTRGIGSGAAQNSNALYGSTVCVCGRKKR